MKSWLFLSGIVGTLAGLSGHIYVWGFQFRSISSHLPNATAVKNVRIVRGTIDPSIPTQPIVVFADENYGGVLEQGWGNELALLTSLRPWYDQHLIVMEHDELAHLRSLFNELLASIASRHGSGHFTCVIATVAEGGTDRVWSYGNFTPLPPNDDDLIRWTFSMKDAQTELEYGYVSRLDLQFGALLFSIITIPASLLTYASIWGVSASIKHARGRHRHGFQIDVSAH